MTERELTEEELVEQIVDTDMLRFAAVFNNALGKLKAAAETNTNALLSNDEVAALLDYMKISAEHLRSCSS
jgi:hypothetical protein